MEDKHKVWLVAGISLAILIIAILVIYPNLNVVAGKAIGSDCNIDEECGQNGYCLYTSEGGVCTTVGCNVNNDCPGDWSCKTMPGSDTASLCVPETNIPDCAKPGYCSKEYCQETYPGCSEEDPRAQFSEWGLFSTMKCDGDFATPCSNNNECHSDVCVYQNSDDLSKGSFCTDLCETSKSCQKGFTCRRFAYNNTDKIRSYCVPHSKPSAFPIEYLPDYCPLCRVRGFGYVYKGNNVFNLCQADFTSLPCEEPTIVSLKGYDLLCVDGKWVECNADKSVKESKGATSVQEGEGIVNDVYLCSNFFGDSEKWLKCEAGGGKSIISTGYKVSTYVCSKEGTWESTLNTNIKFYGSINYVYIDDEDGVPLEDDNCPDDYNPDQLDLDGDGIGDVCDPETTRYKNEEINIPRITPPLSPDLIAVLMKAKGDYNMDGTVNSLDVDLILKHLEEGTEFQDYVKTLSEKSFLINLHGYLFNINKNWES